MNEQQLPPLPEPWIQNFTAKDPASRDHYAADQMREYGRLCAGSLRDHFAAKALAGMATAYHENWTPETLANSAYTLADAMLAARALPQGAPHD
jgi:hypothetical protein